MKNRVILFSHAGYWILFIALLLLVFFFTKMAVPGREAVLIRDGVVYWIRMMTGFAIIPGVITFYSFYTILFTRFLSRKKFVAFLLSGILISVFAAFAGALAGSFVLYGPGFLLVDCNRTAYFILMLMSLTAFMNGCFGLVIKGFINWYEEIQIREELNKKQYEMELALVKSQLDPHFLFNTINNIDVLIENEPDRASAYLNKLSEMMRFMLYETKTELIRLSKELDYLEKYIALQKIRSSNADYIHFNVKGDSGNLMIAPMLFIPFVENAFKHVEDKKKEKAIDIWLMIGKDKLTFICENTYSKITAVDPAEGGIGDLLIQRRLTLLYPDHQLKISRNNNIHRVELILKRYWCISLNIDNRQFDRFPTCRNYL